jgi:hypothetical protein
MILVASRSIFSLFSSDEEVFVNSLVWKRLLLRTCSTLLWEGERAGKRVAVWGGKGEGRAPGQVSGYNGGVIHRSTEGGIPRTGRGGVR